MKNIFHFVAIIILLSSCAYDPAEGSLIIENHADSVIFVSFNCSDEIPERPVLEWKDSTEMIDSSHFIPDYRIPAHRYTSIIGFGLLDKNSLPCKDDEKLHLFFISNSTLKNYRWRFIRKNRMFIKSLVFTNPQLDSMKWIVKYR